MNETIEPDFIIDAPEEEPERPPLQPTGWESVVFVLEDDCEQS